MLTLVILLFHLYPGPQHFVHTVYYILRFLVTEDTLPVVKLDKTHILPTKWSDLWVLPIVTLCLTPPQPATSDFAFVPYIVCHTMGYPSPVWFSVLHGALLTVYLATRPQAILTFVAALAHRYIRRDNFKYALLVAAALHLAMSTFETFTFTVPSVITCILMAEAKLHMRWQHEWIPPVESPLATPAYIGNLFMWGWHNTWKYTDKVWNSIDILYPIANIAGAALARELLKDNTAFQ